MTAKGVDINRITMTSGEIARALGVATKTASKWCDKGLIRGVYRLPGGLDRRAPARGVIEFAREHGMRLNLPPRFAGALDPLIITNNPEIIALGGRPLSTVEAAMAIATEYPPVIVFDRMQLGRGDVLELVRMARRTLPPTRLIVVPLREEQEIEFEQYAPAQILNRVDFAASSAELLKEFLGLVNPS